MENRRSLDFYSCVPEILRQMNKGGILCTVADAHGGQNLLTLSWGQMGPFYHDNPVFIIAIARHRYSWRFLEEVPEFVISVPDDTEKMVAAAALCGSKSGRDVDKFQAAKLRRVPSVHVSPPSVLECPINVECRVYARTDPPHMLLTPEHRARPPEEHHTIYFAEVLGTYGWRTAAGQID